MILRIQIPVFIFVFALLGCKPEKLVQRNGGDSSAKNNDSASDSTKNEDEDKIPDPSPLSANTNSSSITPVPTAGVYSGCLGLNTIPDPNPKLNYWPDRQQMKGMNGPTFRNATSKYLALILGNAKSWKLRFENHLTPVWAKRIKKKWGHMNTTVIPPKTFPATEYLFVPNTDPDKAIYQVWYGHILSPNDWISTYVKFFAQGLGDHGENVGKECMIDLVIESA